MIGQKALGLILQFEGWDVASEWPGDASGITIPYGYDLGYEPFQKDWQGLLPTTTFSALGSAVGLRGQDAKRIASKFRGIKIPKDAADRVFQTITLPRYIKQTSDVFPGSETLPPDAFGALVSLIYNRGILIDGTDRRREMLALHKLFLAGAPFDLAKIADLVESQKRLWPNKHTGSDLYARRVAEAALIRGAVQFRTTAPDVE